MCAVALRFIGSPDIAQDITQEVIIKFWKNRANYENIKSTDNFLYTMIKNEALNYLRGSQREKQHYNHLEVEEFEHPKVLNMLIEEEINQILIHAIDLAITEAAVGAGVTSILFFVTLKKIHAIVESEEEEGE